MGLSTEHRKKIGDALRGRPQTPEAIAARAAALTGRKGHPASDKQKQAVSQANTGVKKSLETIERMRAARRQRPDYKGVTEQNLLERDRFRKITAQRVLARDNYTCRFCGQTGGDLHTDHIKPWSEYPELRFDMDNCRTLCRPCHYYVTFKRKMPLATRWGVIPKWEKIR